MYKKTFLSRSAAPCAGHTSVPQWHVDQRHLGNIHPQLCVVEAKSIFGRMHMFDLRGWELVVWKGGRGRLMRAEGLCPTIISATCTHIEHLSRLAGCWSNAFWVAAMSIIPRSKLLLRSSQCLVWCVNVEAFWLLADLRGLYSNNSDRALWGHIAAGRLGRYTRCLHIIRWSDLQSSHNKIKVL